MAHHNVQRSLEIGEYLFSNAHEGGKKGGGEGKGKKPPPYITPFGAVKPLTIVGMVASMWTLLTSFFTESINERIITEFSGEEVLGIMFLIVFLWFSVAPTLMRIAMSVPSEGLGWRMTWVMAIQYSSQVVLLIAFGYAAIFLKTMWIRAGLLLVELLVITVVMAFFAFGAYAHFLWQEKMDAEMKKE